MIQGAMLQHKSKLTIIEFRGEDAESSVTRRPVKLLKSRATESRPLGLLDGLGPIQHRRSVSFLAAR
jgi:hypothetical protein